MLAPDAGSLCFLCINLRVASPPHLCRQSSFVFARPGCIHASLLPFCCADPTCSGEEQPDPAILSETGPAAAPRPGDEYRRTGSIIDAALSSPCVFCAYGFRDTPLPVRFLGDGAPVCACPAAGVCATRRRRDGGDSSC